MFLPRIAFPCSAILIMCVAGCTAEPSTGDGTGYSPVTKEELIQAEFSHRTGRKKFEFDWRFDESKFVIEGSEIPSDLVAVFLGREDVVDRLDGTWSIVDQTVEFVTESDGENRVCSLPVFFTGVIRLQTDSAQYVFD